MPNRPIQVLAIEDDPSLSFVLEEALEHADRTEIDVVMVSTLEEALAQLGERDFEVILLDLSLPDSEGPQTYSAVRAAAEGTPVVVLTGQDDPELAHRIRELGADDFLLKGEIGSKTLIERIRLYAGRKDSGVDPENDSAPHGSATE